MWECPIREASRTPQGDVRRHVKEARSFGTDMSSIPDLYTVWDHARDSPPTIDGKILAFSTDDEAVANVVQPRPVASPRREAASMRLDGDMLGFQAGLALGLASMVSIGPNNLLLMREGLKRGRTVIVPSLVWAIYVALIAASFEFTVIAGSIDPSFHVVLLALGFAAICWFAFLSFRAFVKGRGGEDGAAVRESVPSCIVRVLSVVCLNPLTYLERFFIPAALQQSFETETTRLQFVTALVLTSMLTCYGFSFGGGLVASFLRNRTWIRIFDLVSGFILACVATSLAARLVAVPL